MPTGLENELTGSGGGFGNVLVNGVEMPVSSVDPVFGEQVDLYAPINWEDSYDVASAQLGVSEEEWQTFIAGVNDIKARSADYQASRAFQEMQALRDRRVLNLLTNNPEMTEQEAVAQVEGSDWYQGMMANQEGYMALNDELNALYESVGLPASGSITGGTQGKSGLTGAGVVFDPVTGSLTHHEGDLFHDLGKAGVIAAAGFIAGPAITSALTPALGAAGAKAASAAIVNIAKQYVTTGDLDWGDALLAAATSYGGAQLSEALNGSGVIGDIGSQINDFGNSLMEGGGDILSAALQAGGMSLVTQMVQEGEIDWKDAAIAAAMAGGTTALQGFLSDIGKSDAEGDVLQEISVTAQRKGTQVGEGLWQLDDGTVISDSGNVLGNMTDLDLDGDGILNSNDLQEIDVNHDFVDPNYEAGDSFYDKYPVPDSTTNPTAFTEEWASERYGSLSESQTVAAMQRDGFTDEQIDAYLDGRYDDVDALNPNIVTHAGGWVENMEQPYTLEARNGSYYIIQDGKLRAISADQYEELGDYLQDHDATQLETGMTADQYMQDQGITTGTQVLGGYDEYGRPVYTTVSEKSDWITLDGTQPPVTAPIDAFTKEPPETETPQTDNSTNQNPADGNPNNDSATGDPNDSSDAGMGDGGGNTDSTGGDEGADGTAGGSDGGSTGGGSTGGGIDTGDIGSGGDDSSSGTTTPTPTDPNANPVDTSGGNTGGNTDNTGGNTTNDSGNGTNTGSGTESGAGGVTGSETGAGSGSGSGDGSASGTESGSGNAGTDSGAGSSGGGAGSDGTTGGGAGTGAGTGGGVGGGAGSDTGGGEGDVDGSGSGTEAGSGDGAGGGGAGGGGLGSGQGMLSGNNSNDRPVWGPLFAGNQFKPRDKARAQVKARLFDDLFKDYV